VAGHESFRAAFPLFPVFRKTGRMKIRTQLRLGLGVISGTGGAAWAGRAWFQAGRACGGRPPDATTIRSRPRAIGISGSTAGHLTRRWRTACSWPTATRRGSSSPPPWMPPKPAPGSRSHAQTQQGVLAMRLWLLLGAILLLVAFDQLASCCIDQKDPLEE